MGKHRAELPPIRQLRSAYTVLCGRYEVLQSQYEDLLRRLRSAGVELPAGHGTQTSWGQQAQLEQDTEEIPVMMNEVRAHLDPQAGPTGFAFVRRTP